MKESLIREINADENDLYKAGRKNHYTDLFCWYGAILASFLATVLAALGHDVPPWLTAPIAAIPALCASLQKVIDFSGRASWYFEKATQMQAILLNLKYENMSVQEAAQKLGEIETKFEERWTKLVKMGASLSTDQ